MTKYILLISSFLVFLTLPAKALSLDQVLTIKKCFKVGEPYDLGKAMAGICYHESRAGLYKINAQSQDYGLTQINIKTALNRLNLKKTWHNKQSVATNLVQNDDLALFLAIQELRYWKETRKRSWRNAISSYNQGSKIDNYDYYDKVVEAIRFLERKQLI